MIVPKGMAIFAGLLFAGLALVLAIGFVGGGWEGPYICSAILPIVYPIVFVRLANFDDTSIMGEAALLCVAVLANFALFWNSLIDNPSYFAMHLESESAYAWFVLWYLWHILTVGTLIARIRRSNAQKSEIGSD